MSARTIREFSCTSLPFSSNLDAIASHCNTVSCLQLPQVSTCNSLRFEIKMQNKMSTQKPSKESKMETESRLRKNLTCSSLGILQQPELLPFALQSCLSTRCSHQSFTLPRVRLHKKRWSKVLVPTSTASVSRKRSLQPGRQEKVLHRGMSQLQSPKGTRRFTFMITFNIYILHNLHDSGLGALKATRNTVSSTKSSPVLNEAG